MQVHTEQLFYKIQQLPPEKLAVVDDFENFLQSRSKEESLVRTAAKLSEDSFRKTWDNPEDAEYDNL